MYTKLSMLKSVSNLLSFKLFSCKGLGKTNLYYCRVKCTEMQKKRNSFFCFSCIISFNNNELMMTNEMQSAVIWFWNFFLKKNDIILSGRWHGKVLLLLKKAFYINITPGTWKPESQVTCIYINSFNMIFKKERT